MNELLSIREVASQLGYSGATIRRWISEGKINHVRFSSRGIRVPRGEVARLVEIGRRPAEWANQPSIYTTALTTNNPASSGTSRFN
jgi:excisionase family DNA binding protein